VQLEVLVHKVLNTGAGALDVDQGPWGFYGKNFTKVQIRVIYHLFAHWYPWSQEELIIEEVWMKAVVNEDLCIGSGNCEETCPVVFKVVDGISRVQLDVVPADEEKKVRQAVDGCPAGAISVE